MLLADRIRDVLPRWGRHHTTTGPHKALGVTSAPLKPSSARYQTLKRGFRCGGNASVDLCVDQVTGRRVVLKRVYTHKKNPTDAELEGHLHSGITELEHPNICEFLGLYRENGNTVLVSEYCEGGDLIDTLPAGDGLPVVRALELAADLMSALARLHGAGYVHADVKIDNCCLTRSGRLKLIDFGGAVYINDVDHVFRPGSSTLTYTAPEVFANKCTDPRAADVWSAGVVLFTLLTGTLPWEIATSRDHSYLRHWRGDESPRWRSLTDDLRALLRAMLHTSPLDRISAATAHTRLVELLAARRRIMEKSEHC